MIGMSTENLASRSKRSILNEVKEKDSWELEKKGLERDVIDRGSL